MREPELVSEEFYHVFNRGVDKRPVFLDKTDYQRFYESLYLFNDVEYIHHGGNILHKLNILSRASAGYDDRTPLVRIVSFCLLTNHFHLLIQQLSNGGISAFLHRFGGYAKYFNHRHKRTGGLFEKSFEARLVKQDEYFLHLPRYIHLNALDEAGFQWRDGAIAEWDKAERALDAHIWSSHGVYMGRSQELPVIDEAFVRELFPIVEDYQHFLRGWSGRNVPSLGDGTSEYE